MRPKCFNIFSISNKYYSLKAVQFPVVDCYQRKMNKFVVLYDDNETFHDQYVLLYRYFCMTKKVNPKIYQITFMN